MVVVVVAFPLPLSWRYTRQQLAQALMSHNRNVGNAETKTTASAGARETHLYGKVVVVRIAPLPVVFSELDGSRR